VVTDLPQRAQSTHLPPGWDVVALGEIGEALIGLTYDPACVSSHGTLVLRSSNIQNDDLSFDDNVFVQTPIPDRLRTRPGDILICARNGSASLIGKCLHLDERSEGETFGAFMAVFRSPEHRYVFHQFRSGAIKRQIGEQLGATINQITNASLNSFTIPFPKDPKERAAIVSVLDDLDSLTASIVAELIKRRDLKVGASQELLSGARRIPGFTGGWTQVSLRDVADVDAENISGSTSPDFSFRYVALDDVQRGVLRSYTERTYGTAPSRARRVLRVGDVLYATVRPNLLGHILWTRPGKWVGSTGFAVVRSKPAKSDPRFVYAKLLSAEADRQVSLLIAGSNYPAINGKDLESLVFTWPELDEQVAIGTVIADMNSEIGALEAQLAKTRDLKTAMAQELLSGRTRLV
jgi:type I restriction enzyme S subunit